MDTYKSLNINIGTVIKNPEMLKLVPDHLKPKQIYNCAVKRYVPNQYKTKKCVIELF